MPNELRRILASLLVTLVVESPALADDPAPADETVSSNTPAPVATFAVRGTLTDASTREGLPAATIQITDAKGQVQTFATELDGTFSIALPIGTYAITFSTLEYDDATRTVVVTGVPVNLALALSPTTRTGSAETIEVSSKIDTRKESAVLAVRRAAQTVSDAVSAQEIARTPDNNAGDAMKRVVAVSVMEGKYVALRGLEGRYVTSLLNGVLLPSPEPDRNAVPLDLFPTSLLSTMTVYKSYAAELPAQFGGGVLQIDTSSFPTSFELKLGVTTSANSVATGQDGLSNASAHGLSSFLGFDDGSRRLPSTVPRSRAVRGMEAGAQEAIGESFSNVWTPRGETVTPNLGLTATIGDTRRIAGKRVGYLASAMMKRSFNVRTGTNAHTSLVEGMLVPVENLAYQVGTAEGTVGGLANAGIELSNDDQISVFGLYSHVGEDTSSFASGYSDPDGSNIDVSRLSFVTRSLGFAQVRGKHMLARADGVELSWQGNLANTTRNELDSRDLVYTVDGSTATRRYKDQPGSGQHFWQALDDLSGGAGVDATAHIGIARLRAGTMLQSSRRALAGRRFRFKYVGNDTAVRGLAGEDMFGAEHVGPDFILEEGTLNEDAYNASLAILGGYASSELELGDKWRAIVGARYERSTQEMSNGSIYAIAGLKTSIARTDDDVLPTANLVYAVRPDMNLRAAYSYTLVRPRFRELAPFLFFDYIRRRDISGNPDLRTTHLHNADLRWEWFPTEDEVFAASVFYKRFVDPIEQVISNANSDATFRNADAGSLAGGELEARMSLARISPVLSSFKLATNLAVMRSRVQLGAGAMLLTSKSRPLYGQSPFVINASLGYANPKIVEVNVLYNVIGRRITDVGVEGLPDTYEAPMHRLDLVAARMVAKDLRLKLGVSNLLNRSVRLEQGALALNTYDLGVSVSLGLDWTP